MLMCAGDQGFFRKELVSFEGHIKSLSTTASAITPANAWDLMVPAASRNSVMTRASQNYLLSAAAFCLRQFSQ